MMAGYDGWIQWLDTMAGYDNHNGQAFPEKLLINFLIQD